jgi:hypothetical protein
MLSYRNWLKARLQWKPWGTPNRDAERGPLPGLRQIGLSVLELARKVRFAYQLTRGAPGFWRLKEESDIFLRCLWQSFALVAKYWIVPRLWSSRIV